MKTQVGRFNTYLLLLAFLCGAGCQSASPSTNDASSRTKAAQKGKKKKEFSTLRLHLEAMPDGSDRTQEIKVLRENPISLDVEKGPVLDEGDIDRAELVESEDQYLIRIRFTKRGSWLLMNLTSTHIGKHLAIYSQFPQGRWIAAPLISRGISDGVLTFTPDASRQEAQRIVEGLNSVAAQMKKKYTF